MFNNNPLSGGDGPALGQRPERKSTGRARLRCRVLAGVVALLVAAGGVIGGVALSGSGSASSTHGAAGAGGPASPTASLAVPPVPTIAAGSGAANLPGGLSMQIPDVHASNAASQKLADDAAVWLRDWVAAWASGNATDPAYGAYCIMQCRFFLDSMVKMWAHANIRPAGTLRVYNLAAETTDGGYAGAVTVCIDDSNLYALTSSNKAAYNPFPAVGAVMYVFGGVYDTGVNHWIMTQADVTLGGLYCERTTTPH